MQSRKASIAIFHKSVEYEDNVSCPYTPTEVFEAARRVIETKGCEVVKVRNGMYVVQYSETGPFRDKKDAKEWLPVFVMRLNSWRSGGIKIKEAP
ncbi:hypothetical protein LCGC14_1565330 [marine sediment metagenome]|uniref:Uncharacterized protein n=1 Tax=marine sediment metagenome TaxID=412755 RepID=A0A0F9J7E1_9ZZZZ